MIHCTYYFRLRLKSSEGFSLFVKISEKAIPVKDDNFFFDFVRQLTELLKKNKRASDASLLTYQGIFKVRTSSYPFQYFSCENFGQTVSPARI